MKSILYAGVTLMLGASIYGFVDYNQTNHRKEFKEMYGPAKMEAPVVEEKKISVTDKRSGIMESKKVSAEVEPKEGESVVASVSPKEKQPIKKTKKKKKLDYREFSRASLKEFQVVEMKAEEPVKVEKKNTEIKEQ